MPRLTLLPAAAIVFILSAGFAPAREAPVGPASPFTAVVDRDHAAFPGRVLITNDNGIDDPKIVALARAFAERTEVWVIAPATDRSGSGNYLTVTQTGALDVEERDLGAGIRAFAVDGYPADCVALAFAGMMKDTPPDLVVSGINGGENAGADWMFSGTVGAARVAAIAGIPAIAVSGLNDDIPGAVEHAVDWVVRLAASPLVGKMDRLEYLTVSMPRTAPGEIRGVRVADRAPLQTGPLLEQESAGRWVVTGSITLDTPRAADADRTFWEDGYIAVVPMRADEVDLGRLAQWRRFGSELPDWRD